MTKTILGLAELVCYPSAEVERKSRQWFTWSTETTRGRRCRSVSTNICSVLNNTDQGERMGGITPSPPHPLTGQPLSNLLYPSLSVTMSFKFYSFPSSFALSDFLCYHSLTHSSASTSHLPLPSPAHSTSSQHLRQYPPPSVGILCLHPISHNSVLHHHPSPTNPPSLSLLRFPHWTLTVNCQHNLNAAPSFSDGRSWRAEGKENKKGQRKGSNESHYHIYWKGLEHRHCIYK